MKKFRPRGACGRLLPDMAARHPRPATTWQQRDQRRLPPRQRPKAAPSARLAHLLHGIGGEKG